jgi:hypothetical protein
MTDILGLDRHRATAWTLARILQYALWDIERDYTHVAHRAGPSHRPHPA